MARKSMDPICSPSQLVGQRIRRIRCNQGLTGKALGQRLGLSQQHVSRIEAGIVRLNVEQLQHISTVLEVALPDLLSGIGHNLKYCTPH